MNKQYWILTIERVGSDGNYHKETLWIEGCLSNFLLVEKQIGRNTFIINAVEIPEEEYNEWEHSEEKK